MRYRYSLKHCQVERTVIDGVPVVILKPKYKAIRTAVMWIHGGGYFLGMKEMVFISRAMDMVSKYGVTVISPGYRLSVLHPFPAGLTDCYKVLKHLDSHKKEMGFDRLMIGGESAGGGLTCALTLMARDNGIHLAYQMPLYPMLDCFDTDSSRNNHGKGWNTFLNHIGWKLYLRGNYGQEVSGYASPSHSRDYSQLPPCYTFVTDGEPFYCETLDYVRKLQEAGVPAEVDVYHSDVHGIDMLTRTETGKRAVEVFLKHFEHALEHYY